MLKERLRRWNKDVFGWHNIKVDEEVEIINEVDNQLIFCDENDVKELVDIRSKTCKSMWRNLFIKDNMLLQKAMVKWNRDGDLNLNFFHKLIKGRVRRKHIAMVKTEKWYGGLS